ncbi:hypothetical protein TWF481_001026 [Arthrobotrys musiformis]|uniref:Uncharacterized protein n=1 Tax=Arthrobotrys musiformis TaxID=47236 RepID=A0AAV9WQ76_9PEZI
MASTQSPEITPYESGMYSRPHWMNQSASGSTVFRKPVPYQSIDPQISNSNELYEINNKSDDDLKKGKQGPERPPQQSKWGITWQSPALCLVSFFSGVALAIGNHAYFTRLNGTPYENVVWVGRYGLAMALIVKTCFATSILICYEQVVWMGLKTKERGTSFRAIDALFGATYQVVSLFYYSIWIQQPLAAIMITLRWLLPIMSIVAPTTLTVQSLGTVSYRDCQVPTLNLSAPDYNKVYLGNSDPQTGTYLSDLAFQEYTGNLWNPGPLALKVATLTGYLGQPVSYTSPCGNNCSYSLSYNAALWKCTETDRHDKDSPWEIESYPSAPWASSRNGSQYDYTSILQYTASVSNTTGKLWVGHLARRDASNIPNATFWDENDVETFYCEGYNSTVFLRQQFMDGQQHYPIVENVVYGDLINWTMGYTWYTERNITSVDLARHQIIYRILAGLFEGTVNWEGRSQKLFTKDTSILNMPSFVRPNTVRAEGGDGPNDEIKASIRGLAEQLSLNYSMSLLAFPELGVRDLRTENCTVTTFSNVWKYDKTNLIIAYSVGMLVALVSLIVGAMALRQNGLVSEMSFSQVVATTRNPELDKMMQGNSLGRSDLKPRSLYGERLRFGELGEQDSALLASGAAHTAFGRPETTRPIRRQGYYI